MVTSSTRTTAAVLVSTDKAYTSMPKSALALVDFVVVLSLCLAPLVLLGVVAHAIAIVPFAFAIVPAVDVIALVE